MSAPVSPVPGTPGPIPPAWAGLVDDAAVFPPGNAELVTAQASYVGRRPEWWAALVGPLVVSDVLAGGLTETVPVALVVTGGAGALAGALGLLARGPATLAGVEIALRDPHDLPGNARRVVAAAQAAADAGLLPEEVPVHVELPQAEATAGWLSAADEVAAAGLRLKFRTGGTEASRFPTATVLAGWIDAALDRETPFKCTAGLHHAVRHRDRETGFEHHGFLNVLVATRAALDGASVGDVTALLDDQYANDLVALARGADLAGARRWFTSFGSCSVADPLDDLLALGLLEAPR